MRRWFLTGLLLALGVVLVVPDVAFDRPPRRSRPGRHPSHTSSSSRGSSSGSYSYTGSSFDRVTREVWKPVIVRATLLSDLASLGKESNLQKSLATLASLEKTPDLPAEDAKRLEPVVQTGRTSLALDTLRTALRDRNLEAWRRLDPSHLPGPLQKTAADLRKALVALDVLATAQKTWKTQTPDVPTTRQALAHLRETGFEDAANRLAQEASLAAFLAGHPTQARELLPEKGPGEHAAVLLRDFKATLDGSGEVTSPAARAYAREQASNETGPRGPPVGAALLMPEGDARSYRAALREQATSDLPLLDRTRKQAEDRAAPLQASVTQQQREAKTQWDAARNKVEQELAGELARHWLGRRKLRRKEYPKCFEPLLTRWIVAHPPQVKDTDDADDRTRKMQQAVEPLLAVACVDISGGVAASDALKLLNQGDLEGVIESLYESPGDLNTRELLTGYTAIKEALAWCAEVEREPKRLEDIRKDLKRPLSRCDRFLAITLLGQGTPRAAVVQAIDRMGCKANPTKPDAPKGPGGDR